MPTADEIVNTRMVEAVKQAQKRCSELAKIEIIRPRSSDHPAVERLDTHTIAYDPALLAKLNWDQLVAAVVKAANDWTFTPEAPELLDVTEQRDALKTLVETIASELRDGDMIDRFSGEFIEQDYIDSVQARLGAIVGKR